MQSSFLGSHVIVIGGGIAGLLSAHVLSSHFERVSLIERDHYPEEPVFRAGTPQGRHVHIMLVRGQQILEEFFPGIKDKLVAQGAIEGDFAADYIYHFPSGLSPRIASRLKGYACSRSLLEWQVRREVMARERVHFIERHEIVNLLISSDGRTVTGVQMRERSDKTLAEREIIDLPADLVVDASGRDSQIVRWFTSLGYTPPPETVVNPFFGYSSRVYIPPADPGRTWKGLVVLADPPKNLRGGVIWPTEEGNWIVVLGGTGKDYPPTDEDGFLEFIKSIPDPLFYEALKNAQPLSPIYGYRRTENRLRHFESLARLPERFVVLGDAVCAFNPVYGQGMTVAAMGAVALDKSLRQQGLAGLPHRFQRQLARITETPWQLATASDHKVPALEGMKPDWVTRLTYRYFDGLVVLLPTTPSISKTFSEVLHMIEPPTALFRPTIAVRVLLHGLSKH
ncbi:MAG TPA: FAD-dependent monooxygenase [Ktedonobacteraceae bacterium]|nr:FAD-dependent monooxygenase [Ktedonobacteraceae bacterium]